MPNFRILCSLALCAFLNGCGGGSGNGSGANSPTAPNAGAPSSDTSPSLAKVSPSTAESSVVVSPDAPIIDLLEVAQTHVIPAEGKSWPNASMQGKSLHLTAEREALALLKISTPNGLASGLMLEVLNGTQILGQIALNAPSTLPPTEAGGPAYSSTSHWAKIDKSWVRPGLNLQVKNSDGLRSAAKEVKVGAATSFTMMTLPFYLFGVSESAAPFSQTAAPDQATRDEYFAKHPISNLQMVNHPAQKIVWPYIIVGPRQGRAAQKVLYKEQQGDSYAVMSAVLDVLRSMRDANGDSPMNSQYYAPLIMALQSGQYSSPGGGLGGGDVGTGDFSYGGIFIHEAGHAFGMPHANDGYLAGSYPYVGGSLKGSSWGYDQLRNEFLNILVPSNASTYKNCLSGGFPMGRQVDSQNRCIKQDPMQSGAGDQVTGSKYTMFSDFNASVVQNYLEGSTSMVSGKHTYSGGKYILDSTSSTGYSRWDSLDKRYVPVETKTVDGGLYGLDNSLATQRNVPVHTIMMTAAISSITERIDATQLDYADIVSYDATLTQIYPHLSYSGNLRRMIDPSDAQQLATIQPNTGVNYWFCKNSGCDYTLRVTFADNTSLHVVLQVGFRGWFNNNVPLAAQDPLSDSSFRSWAVNVPGSKALKLIELLETPEVYKGMPNNPRVIASRVVN
jgi:Peptidase M66